MIGVCGDWKTNSRIVSVWKAPVHSDRSSVVNWIRPEPSGHPSSAATAKRDSQATRGIRWVLEKAESMKFPAAPESIKAVVSITSPLTLKVTGISRTEDIVEILLTDGGLQGGRVGHEALRCPGRPQYKHRLWRILLSLSSVLRWVKPTCMGSASGGDVIQAEAERKRGCRRERTRLSIWIARSMNWSRDRPSSRHASSDCSSILSPLRKRSLSGSSAHPVCAESVRKDSA